jgi:PST family polysaccharide transporter
MAMAVIVIGFLEIFKDLGLSSALIQKENPSDELKSSIFWISISFGIIISLLIYFTSPIVAFIYNSNSVKPILEVLAISFSISGLSIVQKAIFEKGLAFKLLAKIELFASTTGFITAITLAIYGYGVWSLVFQAIVNVFVSTVFLLFFSEWKPKFIFQPAEVKSVASYSLNLLGFNTVNYFARNSDYFLIGKYLGDNALGHYYLAYRLMLFPIQNITIVISRVLFPSFSLIKKDNFNFRKMYTEATNGIALITFPMMTGLALVSYNFTEVFINSSWNQNLIALLIIILAPIGALQSVISTVGNIYQAKGKTDWMFRWSLFYTAFTVSGFIIGLKWGVTGVAISYLITNILMLYPVFVIPFKLIDMKIINFFKSFKGTIFSVTIMGLIVFFVSAVTKNINNSSLRLLLPILTGIISYVLVSLIINKDRISNIKNIISEYYQSYREG